MEGQSPFKGLEGYSTSRKINIFLEKLQSKESYDTVMQNETQFEVTVQNEENNIAIKKQKSNAS